MSFSESLDCFYKALKLKPDYVEAHYNLGISMTHLGRIEEAILSYTKAIELKPDYTSAHESLIRALAFCNPKKSNLNPCVIANRLLQNINYKYDSNNNLVARFFSVNVILSGRVSNEDPPPDTKNNTKSCFEQLLMNCNVDFPARTLSLSGNGCPE